LNKKFLFLTKSAIIAAAYFTLTILFAPISYSLMQVRIAEGLCVLAYFTPAAVPGLALGCLLSNLSSPFGLIDIVFGTLATGVAAFFASKIKNKYLVPLPSIFVNALVVGYVLKVMISVNYLLAMFWVAAGQILACYGIGLPLLLFIEKNKFLSGLFKK